MMKRMHTSNGLKLLPLNLTNTLPSTRVHQNTQQRLETDAVYQMKLNRVNEQEFLF